MKYLEKYLKNSTKRLTNIICLMLVAAMVVANICGVKVDTTIFFGLIGVIGGNNILSSWQSNNSQFNENDLRTIVKGYQQQNDENIG